MSKRNSLVRDVGEALSLHDGMFRAGISTATETFSAHGIHVSVSLSLTICCSSIVSLIFITFFGVSGKFAGGIVAPYTVYKGKAALSAAPVLPTFSKLDVRLCFLSTSKLCRHVYYLCTERLWEYLGNWMTVHTHNLIAKLSYAFPHLLFLFDLA